MTVQNRDCVAGISTNLLELTIDFSIIFSAGGAAGATPQTNRPSSATTESIFKFYSAKSIGTELSLLIVTFLGDLDVMRGLQTQKVLSGTDKNLHLQIYQDSRFQFRERVHLKILGKILGKLVTTFPKWIPRADMLTAAAPGGCVGPVAATACGRG